MSVVSTNSVFHTPDVSAIDPIDEIHSEHRERKNVVT